jgi:diguanylate cyclase (GGDEF)-like protein
VLLIEDDASFARFAEAMLQTFADSPVDLSQCTSLASALDKLNGWTYDLVLLDLELPDAHELQALTSVVAAAPDLPIVILSGTDDELFALEAVKRGAQDYLIKGHVTPELLFKAVRYAIERKHSEVEARRLAYYDSLTSLPNRRFLIERLNQALERSARDGHIVGVFFIDVDRFKHINDTLGHETGDAVLREFAARMSECLRKTDTLARLSGDEFVAVAEVKRQRELMLIAEALRHCSRTPIVAGAHELFITTSLGVSAYPENGSTAEELLRNADRAMYEAKEQGRDTVRLYGAAAGRQRSRNLSLTSALRRAVERQELLLHFQPLVNLHSGEVDGLEALVRWQHPTEGLVLPDQFIHLAEESGLILAIERWVLEQSMREALKLRRKGISVAVNLSSRHFDSPTLLRELTGILKQVGYDAGALELELTESGISRHPRRVLRHLTACQRLGVRVAVDDFGTGYSCLQLIKQLPLNALKVDRSFVHNCDRDSTNQALVTAIVSMAHAMGLQVTAEGVETDSELAFLRGLKCDRAQGIYFGRPVEISSLGW